MTSLSLPKASEAKRKGEGASSWKTQIGLEFWQLGKCQEEVFFFFFFFNVYLGVLGLSFSMQGLVPWPGIEPRPPKLWALRPSHWTTTEVLRFWFLFFSPFSLSVLVRCFSVSGIIVVILRKRLNELETCLGINFRKTAEIRSAVKRWWLSWKEERRTNI